MICPGQARAQRRPGADRPAVVRAASAMTRELNRQQTFIGTLQPVRRAVIGSAVEDRVAEVLVDEGQRVTGPVEAADGSPAEGQKLVEIQRATIDLEYEAARIELQLREKAVEQLELSIPAEIELARATMRQMTAQRDYAQQVFRRMESLGVSASQRELEESRSQFKSQAQALLATEAELGKLESTREVRLLIARHTVAAGQAELDRLDDLRNKYTITAPFSGYVTAVHVERGNWVTQGAPTIELIQMDPIEMRVSIPQEYLASLQDSVASAGPGGALAVSVRVDALDLTVEGAVAAIIPIADERTRAVPIIVRIANPSSDDHRHRLYPGLLATVSLNVGERELAVMVPKDALVLGQQSTAVFVIDEGTVRRVEVQTGAADDQWISVKGEIHDGDRVVTHGNERLREGQSVEVLKDDSKP